MGLVISAIHTVFSVYSVMLIGRVFLQMILGPYHRVVVLLRRVTEPVLAPIRRFVPPLQGGGVAWDLSPMIALLLLWALEQLVVRLLLSIAS